VTHERIVPLVIPLKGDGELTCIICGRPVIGEREIHIVDGGAAVAHPDYDYPYPESDLGWHSIGRECARLFPPGWALTPMESYRLRKSRLTSR
jgi:hypothetical protein